MIDPDLLDDVHFALLEHGTNWHAAFDTTEINTVSAYWHALDKDTPGKFWWDLNLWHPAVGRALRIDREQEGGAYALLPFRLARIDGKPKILAAYPAPRFLSPDEDWLGIETVIVWDPVTDKATVMRDIGAQLIGKLTEEANSIFSSPRAFFQAWAGRRAQFFVMYQSAVAQRWGAVPTELDEVPGALIVGALDELTLSPSLMPQHLECQGLDPKVLNRAIMRSARLPRVTAANHLRSAA